jgi:threonine/homoserine/homoserine lactone efflux protein
MPDLPPNLIAVLTGFIAGFILSVPVGPVNLTIVNEGARRGLLWGLMIGLGAVTMELIYCALAFTGFASFFDGRVIKAVMELASFVFFLYLGSKFLKVRTIEEITAAKHKFSIKLEPHSAFATGFVRVMGNFGVFLFWIVLAARFRARGWVPPNLEGTLSCVAGVAGGTSLFFAGLSYVASRGKGNLSEKTLLRMEHISGVCLLAVAAGEGVHIVWQMAHHKL